MTWNNLKETSPVNNEEVLIQWNGELHLARFDHSTRLFISPFDLVFDPNKNEIAWMRLLGRANTFLKSGGI
jgi:hypothetical protein